MSQAVKAGALAVVLLGVLFALLIAVGSLFDPPATEVEAQAVAAPPPSTRQVATDKPRPMPDWAKPPPAPPPAPPKPPSVGPGDVAVVGDCKRFVKSQLKAPATAKFAPIYEMRIGNEGNRWSVNGHVDAQNSFGALLRSSFYCLLRYEGTLVIPEEITVQ